MLSIRKSFTWACIAALLMMPISAYSWIDTGHMIVAAIAYRHLKPSVRAKVDALLKIGGDARTDDFYGAACWADDTKTRQTGPWHYIDNYFRSDGKPAQHSPDAENVVWALHKFENVLGDKSASDADRADALRYVEHFVGDIHQPLHAVSRESDEMPNGDAGGNRVRIQPVAGIDMWHPNLHELWDLGCGLYGSVPRPLTPQGKAEIDSLAAKIMTDCPEFQFPRAKDLNINDWMNESVSFAQTVVYPGIEPNSEPSADYLAKGKKVCEIRLALAGYRLAGVLNKLLG